MHASRNTFATKWMQPRIRESKKWKYEKSDSALAPLCKTFNARVIAVMLERKKLVIGPEVTVRASRLARWPHLLRMESIVIHTLVLDVQDSTVFLQCASLAHTELRPGTTRRR